MWPNKAASAGLSDMGPLLLLVVAPLTLALPPPAGARHHLPLPPVDHADHQPLPSWQPGQIHIAIGATQVCDYHSNKKFYKIGIKC